MASRKRRPTGDDATNARKRFYRRAESYLKQAESSTGATASRYRQLAKLSLDDALKTYARTTTQRFSRPIQALAVKLGVDLAEERRKIQAKSQEVADKIRKKAIELGEKSKSFKALRKTKQDEAQLREDEARAILSSPIGKRIIGGTVDIWREAATVETDEGIGIDKSKILPALYEWFNVNNLADLLDKIEEVVKDKLYTNESNDIMYETVKIVLAHHIATSNQVTV